MKYIMINHSHPVIFDNQLTHDMFVGLPGRITSAGFVKITPDNKIKCFGESISLQMEPAKIDELIIKKCFEI